jgi:hypothetical protein
MIIIFISFTYAVIWKYKNNSEAPHHPFLWFLLGRKGTVMMLTGPVRTREEMVIHRYTQAELMP